MENDFPRVLLITKVRVTERDSVGASVGKWFLEWPSERLGQVFFGGPRDLPTIGAFEFALGRGERRFGGMLSAIKRSPLGEVTRQQILSADPVVTTGGRRGTSAAAFHVSRALVQTGLWELVFPPRISARLLSWAASVRPDIIFALASDLALTRLTLLLRDALHLPVCLHVSDDFPGRLYRDSALAGLARSATDAAFAELATSATVRFADLPAMVTDYRLRYGVDFDTLMMCDSMDRFARAEATRAAPDDVLSLVYIGSLGHERWRSLADVARAAADLTRQGMRVRLDIFTPYVQQDADPTLRSLSQVHIHPAVPDREVPAILKGADILVLAEGFSDRALRDVRLSLSSKAHIYMASQRPILVYGRAGGGVVEYARASGWGKVVDCPSVQAVGTAIRDLVGDAELRARLLERAMKTFVANHEATTVREHLRSALASAVQRGRRQMGSLG